MSKQDVLKELGRHEIRTAPELMEAIKREKTIDISLMTGQRTEQGKAS